MYCNDGNDDVSAAELPALPRESLVLEVRPAVRLSTDAAAADPNATPIHESWADCYAPSRLCRIRRKVYARINLDGTRRDVPHFISVDHDDPTYDLYLAQVELCFRFKRVYSDGTIAIEELLLVRYMDDAEVQEDLGTLDLETDKPDPRRTWDDLKRAITARRVRRHRRLVAPPPPPLHACSGARTHTRARASHTRPRSLTCLAAARVMSACVGASS